MTLAHRAIWEAANGPISKGWVIHHKNKNRQDNRLENLRAMSRTAHNKLHSLERNLRPRKIINGVQLSRCPHCREFKNTAEEFHRGDQGACKPCKSKVAKERYRKRSPECIARELDRQRRAYHPKHREAKRAASRKYRQEHLETERARGRKYGGEHRDEQRLRSRKHKAKRRWERDNPGVPFSTSREYQRIYYEQNREKMIAYATEYNRNNPEKYRAYQDTYRARQRKPYAPPVQLSLLK